MNRLQQMRNSKWFDRVYMLTVAIKGFDGLIELLAGIVLLVAPSELHKLMHQLAQYIAHVDTDVTRGGLTIVILFLIVHGIVKLALVYALLRRILWAYPYALGVLVLFLIYQLYVCIVQPSVSMIVFAALDAIIVWVVWGEWRKLVREAE